MKTIGYASILMGALLLASSCMIRIDKKRVMEKLSSGNILSASEVYVTKDTAVAPFSKIVASGAIDVSFVQNPGRCSVSIYASDNIMDYVKVGTEGDTLAISFESDGKSTMLPSGDIKVTVTAPSFDALTVRGSSEFDCPYLDIADKTLTLKVAGSGDADFGTIVSGALDASVAGSGEIDVETMRARYVSVQVSGSGEMSIGGLDAGTVEAKISGSGSVELEGATEKARFSVSGSGDVKAGGLRCGSVETRVSGSGDIEYMDAGGKVRKAD